MNFEIPKIIKPLRLAEYDPAFEAAEIQVWVNPPRSLLADYNEMAKRTLELIQQMSDPAAVQEISTIGGKMMAWMSNIWSQAAPETHMPIEDVRRLVEQTQETDPRLWQWLTGQTIRMIGEHRTHAKKA